MWVYWAEHYCSTFTCSSVSIGNENSKRNLLNVPGRSRNDLRSLLTLIGENVLHISFSFFPLSPPRRLFTFAFFPLFFTVLTIKKFDSGKFGKLWKDDVQEKEGEDEVEGKGKWLRPQQMAGLLESFHRLRNLSLSSTNFKLCSSICYCAVVSFPLLRFYLFALNRRKAFSLIEFFYNSYPIL